MSRSSLTRSPQYRQIKYTGLYGNVYDFIVDYSAIASDKILDIHNYLMEKNNIT